MSAGKNSRRLRLFPAVIVVGGSLLALKGFGLVHNAYAQSAVSGQAPVSQARQTEVAVADLSPDDADSSSTAEVEVLTSLSKRRAQLDAREQSLEMQANLIAAAEKRVDDKIASLKSLQSQMQALLGQRDVADQTQLNSLVKTYASMKPADAARIFNQLDETVALNVAVLMKADVLGAILAKMQPEIAEKLTVRLANRLRLPETASAPVAAAAPADAATQTASLNPAVPAPVTPGAASAPAPITPPPSSSVPAKAIAKPQPVAATEKPPAIATPSASPPSNTATKPQAMNAAAKQQAQTTPTTAAPKPAPQQAKGS